MKATLPILTIAFLSACATTDYRIVESQSGDEIRISTLVEGLADQDVVFLAEEHDNTSAHQTHLALIKELHQRRQLVISLEMFERDVQVDLMMYLLDLIGEEEFLADARPWPNYQDDYRPFVEYAKAEGLMVLAANVPRILAAQVSREGLDAVLGNPNAAREVSAPQDEYWEAFGEAMSEHGGVGGEEALLRFYQAQCLKDDTMAETIVDYLEKARQRGLDPMVVHITGRMHSDRGMGTVARVRNRDPGLKIALVGMESVGDVAEATVENPSIGDYILLVKSEPEVEMPVAPPLANAAETEVVQPQQGGPGGSGPALGFMPDYEYLGSGLRAGEVTAGGPSQSAGMQPGDVVVEVNGVAVEDIYGYMDAMSTLEIGATVKVVVQRDGSKVELSVVVGQR